MVRLVRVRRPVQPRVLLLPEWREPVQVQRQRWKTRRAWVWAARDDEVTILDESITVHCDAPLIP